MGFLIHLMVALSSLFAWNQATLENAARPHLFRGSNYSLVLGDQARMDRNQVSAPASLVKLFTSELSFSSLPGDFRFQTQVQWSETAEEGVIGDLTLIGEGDPDFNIEALIALLKRQGVTHVAGDIEIVDELARVIPKDRSEVGDSGYCYNSLSNALNKDQNCVSLTISANGYHFSDPDINAPVKISRRFGTDYNSTRPHFRWTQKDRGEYQYEIQVSLKNRSQSVKVDVLVPDTRQWILTKFKRLAGEQGIGFIQESPVAQKQSRLYIISSRNMDDLWCGALRFSHNMVADAYFRVISRADKQSFLSLFSNLTIVEGTGLSRENFITSDAIMSLLEEIQRGERFDFYLNCLPRPGEEGTLEKRLKGFSSQMAAKTGSLGGISQLAGFIKETPDSAWTPFVFMYENREQRVRKLRGSQDSIMKKLLQ